MNKENKEMLLAGTIAVAIFVIWFFSNTLGCSTKVNLPIDCLHDKNWRVLEICKSESEICFEIDGNIDCVERR